MAELWTVEVVGSVKSVYSTQERVYKFTFLNGAECWVFRSPTDDAATTYISMRLPWPIPLDLARSNLFDMVPYSIDPFGNGSKVLEGEFLSFGEFEPGKCSMTTTLYRGDIMSALWAICILE
jgi:hypothetical protein